VATLTLELTGIPVDDVGRDFSWPRPEFISKLSTSSSVFDVSILEHDCVDFTIPLSRRTGKTVNVDMVIV
jgi:hypothetical protein